MIAYRQVREQLIERSYEFEVVTRIGPAKAYGYKTRFEDGEHVALVFGDIKQLDSVPVRIHRENSLKMFLAPRRAGYKFVRSIHEPH